MVIRKTGFSLMQQEHVITSYSIHYTKLYDGGCFIGNLKKKECKELLSIPEQFEIALLIALGVPKETVVIDDMKNNDVKYYRDDAMIHHVPKRKLDDIIIKKAGK